MSEFETTQVPPQALKAGRCFTAGCTGEYIARTEFVSGAMVVARGARALVVTKGLAFGNLLAVRNWSRISAPIATSVRLPLDASPEKVTGLRLGRIWRVGPTLGHFAIAIWLVVSGSRTGGEAEFA